MITPKINTKNANAYSSHSSSETTVPQSPLTSSQHHWSELGHSNGSNWVKCSRSKIGHMISAEKSPMKPGDEEQKKLQI